MSLGTAYVGILGQAVGGGREFSGWMSKPWRMVALALGAWLSYGIAALGKNLAPFGLTILDWSSLVVILGCVQTSTQRLLRILRRLKETS